MKLPFEETKNHVKQPPRDIIFVANVYKKDNIYTFDLINLYDRKNKQRLRGFYEYN